ncbi:MAG: hypothetical protein ACRDF7_00495 [Candidatus Limnocylindrales bacterium]
MVDEAPTGRPPPLQRLRRHLRLEDVLLFVWVVLLAPLTLPAAGSGSGFASGPDLLHGLLDLVALVGLAACIGARSVPGTQGGLYADGRVLWVLFPLSYAFLVALQDTATKLELRDSLGPTLAVALLVVAAVAHWGLPPLDIQVRRTLVTPFILATSGYFSGFLAGTASIFDLRLVLADIGNDPRAVAFAVGIGMLGVLLLYVMLVFAPRRVAEREGSRLAWTLRFLLFLVALSLGTTWSAIVAGG